MIYMRGDWNYQIIATIEVCNYSVTIAINHDVIFIYA